MFRDEKIAHMAAYLIKKSGGEVQRLKLMKLMYLADRQSFEDRGCSISGDRFFSMKSGPVLSSAYDLMKGTGSAQSFWDGLIKNHTNTTVHSLRDKESDLDLLSEYDEQVMDEVIRRYGAKSGPELKNYLHDSCPEWEDPGRSSKLIRIGKILESLGYDEETALHYELRATEREVLDKAICRA